MSNQSQGDFTAKQKKVLISEEQDGMMIWLGNNEVIRKSAGQVFYNGFEASVESVAVLPQVSTPGSRLLMQLFAFDATVKKWGAKICETELQVSPSDCEQWLYFSFAHQPLKAGNWYGFKLVCNEGQVAISEGIHKTTGHDVKSMQWTAATVNDTGNFHADFHLAFLISAAA